MKKPKSLTLKSIEELAKVDGNYYKFDLSRLSSEKFDNLLKSLTTMTVNKMTGVGFNIDLLKKTKQRSKNTMKNGSRGEKLAQKKQHQLPIALSSSAIIKKKNATRNLCLLFSTTLPKSETLEFLKFRSLPLKFADIELLSQGIFESNTLRTLRFCDIPIGDAGFERLARALRHKSVINLQLRKCSLTDASGEAMRSLLFYHSYLQNEVEWVNSLYTRNEKQGQSPILCLSNLDLRDNEFTFEYIDTISDPLIDLGVIEVIDLRGNAGITSTVVAKLIPQIPNTTVLTGPSKPIKAQKPPSKIFKSISSLSNTKSKRSLSGTKDSTGRGSPSRCSPKTEKRVKELEIENERLRTLIEYLKSNSNIVELEPGLNIIGPRAGEFVEHVVRLDQLLVTAQDGPPCFLSSSSKPNSSEEL